MPTGALRAPSHNFNAFVIESILDELAHAGAIDPIALRLVVPRRRRRTFPIEGDDPSPYKPERLKRVLTLAAEKAGWGKPLRRAGARHRGPLHVRLLRRRSCRGIGRCAEAHPRPPRRRRDRRRPAGEPAESRSADAGRHHRRAERGDVRRNHDRARPHGAEHVRGLPVARNRDAPEIEVHIVPSTEHPTGFGEIALPPIAPAVANALFAASGTRVRRLPFVSSGFRM